MKNRNWSKLAEVAKKLGKTKIYTHWAASQMLQMGLCSTYDQALEALLEMETL